ncbi:MAG: S8 family serine peptidase, partial [Kiritimatiellaeota bacterium]|nr:S8 family serine peptidase [Kiritimatiellota bacterium]
LGRLPPAMRHGTPPPRLEKHIITNAFHPTAHTVAGFTTHTEEPPPFSRLSTEERQLLKLQRKLDRPGAKPNEALLKFTSAEALRTFLARAEKAGVKVLGQLDGLHIVRVGYDQLGQLSVALGSEAEANDITVDPNFIARIPDILQKEDRPAGSGAASFDGEGFFKAIGATGDRAGWGLGVMVAVVDSGVENHPTFADHQVTHVDLVNDGQPFNGHGTAMASLIGGENWQAPGIAPAAQILDIRVADSSGTSDSFTLAQGITQAADSGAHIINISLGAYGSSFAVTDAINYALNKGSVVIASAGNDATVNQLSYPASIPKVISVGGVDANYVQAYFSNSGPGLDLVAPAVGIQSAYGKNSLIIGDGTSQATAIVSGVLAEALASGATTTATAADWLKQHAKALNLPADRGGAGVVQVK